MYKQSRAPEELSTTVQLNFQNLGEGLRNDIRDLYIDRVPSEAYKEVPDRIDRLNVGQTVPVGQVLVYIPIYN